MYQKWLYSCSKNYFCYTYMLIHIHSQQISCNRRPAWSIGLKVVPGSKYWSSEIILIITAIQMRITGLYIHFFLSQWRYSGDRWMEILWTEMRVRGEECPSLRVPRGSFKKVEMKLWCGLFGLSVTDSNESLVIYEKQTNCPCQPCKHNPAHELIQSVNISCRVDVIK